MSREFERHGKSVILAGEVHRAVAERMQRREQVMVLLNRRGYAPVVLCRKCGADVVCDHCSVALTFHHREQKLLCHYCGFLRAVPDKCPECGSKYLFFLGTGTEKLEEAFRQRFPGRTVARFDRDTTRKRGQMKEILDRFERREIDLLVGTQMIAKGHDFPAVTLVVVLSTDTSLRIPDFRAAERTFQLLTQVAGRSGRGDTPGQVYIQTYFANHYAVRLRPETGLPGLLSSRRSPSAGRCSSRPSRGWSSSRSPRRARRRCGSWPPRRAGTCGTRSGRRAGRRRCA